MVDIKALRNRMTESGMTVTAIADKSDIVRATLYKRLDGKGEFTASEILNLTRTLQMTPAERDQIFFAKSVI